MLRLNFLEVPKRIVMTVVNYLHTARTNWMMTTFLFVNRQSDTDTTNTDMDSMDLVSVCLNLTWFNGAKWPFAKCRITKKNPASYKLQIAKVS